MTLVRGLIGGWLELSGSARVCWLGLRFRARIANRTINRTNTKPETEPTTAPIICGGERPDVSEFPLSASNVDTGNPFAVGAPPPPPPKMNSEDVVVEVEEAVEDVVEEDVLDEVTVPVVDVETREEEKNVDKDVDGIFNEEDEKSVLLQSSRILEEAIGKDE